MTSFILPHVLVGDGAHKVFAVQGDDFHERLRGCRVPALAVTGALDPVLSAEVMRQTWLTWFARGKLVELPGAGHYAMDEAPLDLIRAVEDFLRADDGTPEPAPARHAS